MRLRRPVVAAPEAGLGGGIVPGRETPGSEVLVPLYHAGELVGLWSVRHSRPRIYQDRDAALLALLAPQLALLLAIEASVQPVAGASERTGAFVQTLRATARHIHASSQGVTAAAQRSSHGARQAASILTSLGRDSEQLQRHGSDALRDERDLAAGRATLVCIVTGGGDAKLFDGIERGANGAFEGGAANLVVVVDTVEGNVGLVAAAAI